jgi:hypothetical protein
MCLEGEEGRFGVRWILVGGIWVVRCEGDCGSGECGDG